jgi:hypothetical protein
MTKTALLLIAAALAACAERPGYEPIDAYSPQQLAGMTSDKLLRDVNLDRVPIMSTYDAAALTARLGGVPGASGFDGFGVGGGPSRLRAR